MNCSCESEDPYLVLHGFGLEGGGGNTNRGLLEKTGLLNIHNPFIHRRGPKMNGPLLGAIGVSLIR